MTCWCYFVDDSTQSTRLISFHQASSPCFGKFKLQTFHIFAPISSSNRSAPSAKLAQQYNYFAFHCGLAEDRGTRGFDFRNQFFCVFWKKKKHLIVSRRLIFFFERTDWERQSFITAGTKSGCASFCGSSLFCHDISSSPERDFYLIIMINGNKRDALVARSTSFWYVDGSLKYANFLLCAGEIRHILINSPLRERTTTFISAYLITLYVFVAAPFECAQELSWNLYLLAVCWLTFSELFFNVLTFQTQSVLCAAWKLIAGEDSFLFALAVGALCSLFAHRRCSLL